MAEPLRVGLVGYGYWGPNLARNIYQLRDAELAAVARPGRSAASAYPKFI